MSIVHTGIRHPSSVMKNVIPIVMAGGKRRLFNLVTQHVSKQFEILYPFELILMLSQKLFTMIVIGIYGLIVGVIIGQSITRPSNDRENSYSTYSGLAHLCAGLCCGISGLAAGLCIGIVGDYGVRAAGYRASQITLFPSEVEKEGYSTIPDNEENAGEEISGSDDQNKLFVGMLIMLIFSEALAL